MKAQYNRSDAARLAPRAGPGHLELPAPHEAAPGGNRLGSAVHGAEHDLLRKHRRDALEQRTREDRRAQVAHVPSEHLVKRFALVEAETDRETFFLGTTDLIA